MVRASPAKNAGPPNGAPPTRVSKTRHGVMATNTAGPETEEAAAAGFTTAMSRGTRPCMAAGLLRGCQYSGAGQLLTVSGDGGATYARTETMLKA